MFYGIDNKPLDLQIFKIKPMRTDHKMKGLAIQVFWDSVAFLEKSSKYVHEALYVYLTLNKYKTDYDDYSKYYTLQAKVVSIFDIIC